MNDHDAVRAIARAAHADRPRDAHWDRAAAKHLLTHNRCENPLCRAKLEVVDGRRNLEIHHVLPFEYFPELEMDESNWVVLCRAPHDCHRLLGHLSDFKAYNPLLRKMLSILSKLVGVVKLMLKLSRAASKEGAKDG